MDTDCVKVFYQCEKKKALEDFPNLLNNALQEEIFSIEDCKYNCYLEFDIQQVADALSRKNYRYKDKTPYFIAKSIKVSVIPRPLNAGSFIVYDGSRFYAMVRFVRNGPLFKIDHHKENAEITSWDAFLMMQTDLNFVFIIEVGLSRSFSTKIILFRGKFIVKRDLGDRVLVKPSVSYNEGSNLSHFIVESRKNKSCQGNQKNEICILQWNICGFISKLGCLLLTLTNTTPDIICLNETKCSNTTIIKAMKDHLLNFHIYHDEVTGVGMLIKDGINYQLNEDLRKLNLPILAIDVKTDAGPLTIATYYRLVQGHFSKLWSKRKIFFFIKALH